MLVLGPGGPLHSFRGLLGHPATLTRNLVRSAAAPAGVPMLIEPTSEQRRDPDGDAEPAPADIRATGADVHSGEVLAAQLLNQI